MRKLLWSLARPIIREWLVDRALRLPLPVRTALARQLEVPPEVLDGVTVALADHILADLDHWTP